MEKDSAPEKKRIVKEKMQMIFLATIFVLILIFGPFTYQTHVMISHFESLNSNYSWPKFSDFWVCLVVAAVWMCLEKLIKYLFYDYFYSIARESETIELRKLRALKSVKCLYKLIYYSSITIYGYIVLKDSIVLVPELGGSGNFYDMFKGWPYLEFPPIYKYYYLISLGYHIG